MPVTKLSAPQSEAELMQRANLLAGRALGDIAAQLQIAAPENLRRHKGWVGQLLELALGADADSLPEPDFRSIGVELKTLPIGRDGKPRESTYVCTVPLDGRLEPEWGESWLCRKLSRVLWLPVEAEPDLPLSLRRVGCPLLWSPNDDEAEALRLDWEELGEMIRIGELESITARMGTVLQIRPKAANSRVTCESVGADGEVITTHPRGFYLRPTFTHSILQRYTLS
ncbi:MAG: DNA mismatch repair endonuclease MutH [Chromatiales bacterium]|nr:DNA mismatch repair endonuclease MutH [Chromatiales bacterium]